MIDIEVGKYEDQFTVIPTIVLMFPENEDKLMIVEFLFFYFQIRVGVE